MKRFLLPLSVLLVFGVYFYVEGKTKPEVVLWGSVHEQHTKAGVYPLSILTSALESEKPDAVFIEMTSEDLAEKSWVSAPPETALIYVTARRLNIPVYGFDAKKSEEAPKAPSFEIKKLREELIQETGGYGFRDVHSKNADHALKKYYETRDKKRADPAAKHREDRMDSNLTTLLQNTKGRKFFVIAGFTHRPHLAAVIRSCCHLENPKTPPVKDISTADLKEARTLWQATLEKLKTQKASERKIQQVESFVK